MSSHGPVARAATLPSRAFLPLLLLSALFLAFWLQTGAALGAQANLTWDPPVNADGTATTNVGGYNIYRGTTSGSYSQTFNAGAATTYTDSSIIDGNTYYYAVTAYDNGGSESSYSNQMSITIPVTGGTTPGSPPIPKTGWKLVYADSQETKAANRAAVNAFDGNTGTLWITDWTTTNAPCPHEIQIDLGKSYDLDSFSYTPPQDGSVNGRIATYEFYVSSDTTNWGSPVASGNLVNDATVKKITFPRTTGRFIRLRALAEVNGNPWTSAAEIDVTGAASATAPTIYTISTNAGVGGAITPSGTSAVTGGASQTFAISPSAGYAISGVTVDGTGIGSVSSYTFSNLNANHTIAATFTPVGSGSSSIPKTNWRLLYADSQEVKAANRAAVNGFDGDPSTLWITDWTTTNAPCPHDIMIDLGQSYNLDSFTYLPPQDGSVNGRIAKYEFYVSNDTNWGTAVATGSFANDATAKKITFTPKAGRYIRLRSIAEVNGNPWTSMAELDVTGTPTGTGSTSPSISHTGWNVVYTDSQETKAANRSAANAIDGLASTLWITDWTTTNAPCPHEIQIDLGQSYNLDAFSYLPPQDGSVNGRIAKYELYVSNSTSSWGTPVATGTFANDDLIKLVNFTRTSGRYMRLRALSEVNGNPWTSAAEINAYGVPSGIVPSGTAATSPQIPHTAWKLVYADSQETKAANRAAVNAFDGDPSTLWITDWATTNAPVPHEIQIDLGQSYNLDSFSYLPPQDGSVNGRIAQYEFYVSNTTGTWGSPVAAGTFVNDAAMKNATFPRTNGRYIRLRALAEVNGNPWTSAAEINVTGTP